MGHRGGGVRRRHHPRLLRRHAARRRQTVLRLCQGHSDLQRRHRTFAQHAARRGRLVDGQELRPRLVFDVARPFSPQMDSRAPRLRRDPRPAQTLVFPRRRHDARSRRLPRGGYGRRAAPASMFNLGRRYTIQGKFYFDPRANVVVCTAAISCRRPESLPAIGRRCRLAHQIPDDGQPLSRHGVFRFHPAQLLACESRTPADQPATLHARSDELRPACRTQFQGRFASDADWNDNQRR